MEGREGEESGALGATRAGIHVWTKNNLLTSIIYIFQEKKKRKRTGELIVRDRACTARALPLASSADGLKDPRTQPEHADIVTSMCEYKGSSIRELWAQDTISSSS